MFGLDGRIRRPPGEMVRSADELSTKVLNGSLKKNVDFGIIERIACPECSPRACNGAFVKTMAPACSDIGQPGDVFTGKVFLTVFHKRQGAIHEPRAGLPLIPSVSPGKHYVSLQIGHEHWILKVYVET